MIMTTDVAEIENDEEDGIEVFAEQPDPSWGSIQAAKKYPRSIKAF